MKNIFRLLPSLFLTLASVFSTIAGETAEKPNVIVIFTDDQGYQDVGCFGSPKIKTPELDRMAKEGKRFTSFYVAAPVCSTSRAALLTGRYPVRIGSRRVYFPNSDDGLNPSEITIAEVLKKQGYVTGCIGKWHLGHKPEYLPMNQGFDSYFGVPYSNDMWLDPVNIPPADDIVLKQGKTLDDYKAVPRKRDKANKSKVPLMRGGKCIEWPADQSQLTRRYTEEAISFIKANKKGPFFLYLAHTMPHVPLFASDKFKGKSERGLYGDVVEEVDWSVGQVLKTLRDEGLAENTLVVYSSDNGPWLRCGANGGSALPLRDGKFSTFEGGQRVPCIMWWPGQIPASTECNEIATTLDVLPTVTGVAGAKLTAETIIDGHNILNLLTEDGATSPYDAFFYGTQAVRVGKWKYRAGRSGKKGGGPADQLFDLEADIGEKINLATKNPQKTKELKQLLDDFRAKFKKPKS